MKVEGKFAAACILLLTGAIPVERVQAQQDSGPFTEAQVTAGRNAYAENCMTCHQANLSGEGDAVALTGKGFVNEWSNKTTNDLYHLIQKTMPYGNGGSLDNATYLNIAAFLLHANGAHGGDQPLSATTAVRIGALVNGVAPPDVVRGVKPAGRVGRAPRSADNGAGMITHFGQTVVGDIKNYAPVTDATLTHPADADWLMGRRNYQAWSYSPLKQITTENVKQLRLKWVWAMNEGGANETTPIVYNGIMFLGNTYNTIQALDAKTGELLWENRVGPAPSRPNYGGMRSIAVWGDKVYFAGNDAVLHALNARSGKLVWSTPLSAVPGRNNTSGVLAIHGKILTGLTGCGERPVKERCFISAYDAETGKQVWKFDTVALKGEPNGDSWGNLPDDQRAGAETWIAGSYDPSLNLTYWGTAQAKPWRRDERGSGSGATDYANSTLALDPDTGKLKWFYNHAPGESFDLDEVFERVLVDHGDQKSLLTVGKAGILWKLDRVTGKYIDSKMTVFQNIFTGQDKRTGQPQYRPDIVAQRSDQWLSSCPGPEGGHDWPATSYDAPNDLIVVPLSQSCVMMLGNGSELYYFMPGTDGNLGRLSAYRASTLQPVWSFQQRAPFLTAVLTTGGNLAFVGDFDRHFQARDVRTGSSVWDVRLGTTVQGFPVSYAVNGQQYIAVMTGLGGGSPEVKPSEMLREVHRPNNGQALYVFGLPD